MTLVKTADQLVAGSKFNTGWLLTVPNVANTVEGGSYENGVKIARVSDDAIRAVP
jgi:hypothetical protein